MSLFIDDIADFLEDESIGTVGTDIFVGREVDADDGTKSNTITLTTTGGPAQDIYLPTKLETFEVYVRNSSYAAGHAKINAVRASLHQFFGQMGSTYFYNIEALSGAGHVGRDDTDTAGREEFSINFIAKYR